MELRQLKYFLEIVKHGSFSETSRVCYLSQSAISQQIKALEDEFGVPLFIRTPHKVVLTEHGERLVPIAKRVLKGVADCTDCLQNSGKELAGELNIGLTYSLESYMRNTAIEFLKKYPKVRINVRYSTIPDLMHMLRENTLDVAMSVNADGCEELYEKTELMKYRLCAIMRTANPLGKKQELSLSDLEHQSIVLPESSTFMKGITGINTDDLNLNIRATVNAPASIISFIRQTDYIGIFPEHMVKGIKDLCAIPIKELPEYFTSSAYFSKGEYRKRSSEVFIQMLKEEINKQMFAEF